MKKIPLKNIHWYPHVAHEKPLFFCLKNSVIIQLLTVFFFHGSDSAEMPSRAPSTTLHPHWQSPAPELPQLFGNRSAWLID
jgi:hypothetical protein